MQHGSTLPNRLVTPWQWNNSYGLHSMSCIQCSSTCSTVCVVWHTLHSVMYVSRQQKLFLGLKVLMLRLDLNVMTFKLRYDIIIHNFHPFIFCIYVFKTFKTKLQLCIKQCFKMQATRVRCVCVASWIFSLIHLLGILTVLPRPDSQLPRLSLVNATSAATRENCLTHITSCIEVGYPSSRDNRVSCISISESVHYYFVRTW